MAAEHPALADARERWAKVRREPFRPEWLDGRAVVSVRVVRGKVRIVGDPRGPWKDRAARDAWLNERFPLTRIGPVQDRVLSALGDRELAPSELAPEIGIAPKEVLRCLDALERVRLVQSEVTISSTFPAKRMRRFKAIPPEPVESQEVPE